MEEERNRVLKAAQTHIAQKSAQAVDPANQQSTSHSRSVAELRLMSDLMEDMQRNLEPLRDRALDEKARLTGYSQCAEAMIKIIADRAAIYKQQAVELARQQFAQEQEKAEPEDADAEEEEKQEEPKAKTRMSDLPLPIRWG